MRQLGTLTLILAIGNAGLAAETVDEIIQKTVQALGGAERLQSLQSLLLEGEVLLGGGIVSGEFQWLTRRPNHLKISVQVGDQEFIQAYDGHTAWQLQPISYGGAGVPEVIEGPGGQAVEQASVFEYALVNYREKGHRAERMPDGEVRGKAAYRIKLTLASGKVNEYFIDKETFLPGKIITTRFNPQTGADSPFEQWTADYREVEGIQIAHRLETYLGGQAINEFKVTRAEVNAPASAKDFERPAG